MNDFEQVFPMGTAVNDKNKNNVITNICEEHPVCLVIGTAAI